MSCVINSDLLSCLKLLPDNSFDGVFCDPPYELGFMGKSWDSTGIAFCQETWAEVLRVCKPGAHLLAFGGSRTFHRLVCAVEDAGWEVRDVLMWLYGSGFPKSLDVSKAIDKAAGAEREVVGTKIGIPGYSLAADKGRGVACVAHGDSEKECQITAPATDAARQWDGWGTALKPAYEPVVLARKPLDGTVAQNVQKWGCGALWIDGGRIPGIKPQVTQGINTNVSSFNVTKERRTSGDPNEGRFPANVLHDGSPEVVAGFPQSDSKGGGGKPKSGFWGNAGEGKDAKHGDSGSAARFFYCAKASQKERNAWCEALPAEEASEVTGRLPGSPGLVMNGGKANPYAGITGAVRRNVHPTVKPLDLCRYLATLILPPVDRPHGPRRLLVPFSGSGSEMVGAVLAGWDDVTGIEREAEYVEIAKARLSHHSGKPPVVLLPEWLDL